MYFGIDLGKDLAIATLIDDADRGAAVALVFCWSSATKECRG